MYAYVTGESVQVGDRVLAWKPPVESVVALVLYPGTPEAEQWQCPRGGILLVEARPQEEWKHFGRMMISPGDLNGEVTFLRRGTTQEIEALRRGHYQSHSE